MLIKSSLRKNSNKFILNLNDINIQIFKKWWITVLIFDPSFCWWWCIQLYFVHLWWLFLWWSERITHLFPLLHWHWFWFLLQWRLWLLSELLWSWAVGVRLLVEVWSRWIVIHEWIISDSTIGSSVAIIASIVNLNSFFVFVFPKIYWIVIYWSDCVLLLERVVHCWSSWLSCWHWHCWSSVYFWRKLRLSSTRERSTTTSTSCHWSWFVISVLRVGSKSIWFVNRNICWFINH